MRIHEANPSPLTPGKTPVNVAERRIRTRRVAVRLQPLELERMDAAARANNQQLSEWMRTTVLALIESGEDFHVH